MRNLLDSNKNTHYFFLAWEYEDDLEKETGILKKKKKENEM